MDITCLDQQAREDLEDLGYIFNSTTRFIPYNVTVDPTKKDADVGTYSTDPNLALVGAVQTEPAKAKGLYEGDSSEWTLSEAGLRIAPAECIYQSLGMVHTSMTSLWFNYYFNGTLTDSFYNSGVYGSIVPQATYNIGKNVTTPGEGLEGIRGMMQNISDSMTTYMRWHGNVNMSKAVEGEVHRYAVCVHVRWPYLAHSAAVTCLLLVFFTAMLVNTWVTAGQAGAQSRLSPQGRQPEPPAQHDFKASALAVLFHGLDRQSQERLHEVGATNKVGELKGEAKARLVKLVLTNQGWKLSSVHYGDDEDKVGDE